MKIKKREVGKDERIEGKINLVFFYLKAIDRQLVTISTIMALVFILLILDVYSSQGVSGQLIEEKDLFSPLGVCLVLLVLALGVLNTGRSRKTEIEKQLRSL